MKPVYKKASPEEERALNNEDAPFRVEGGRLDFGIAQRNGTEFSFLLKITMPGQTPAILEFTPEQAQLVSKSLATCLQTVAEETDMEQSREEEPGEVCLGCETFDHLLQDIREAGRSPIGIIARDKEEQLSATFISHQERENVCDWLEDMFFFGGLRRVEFQKSLR